MENLNYQKSCCPVDAKKEKGFLIGILSGILPHTFCILFIVFTVLGTATLTSLLKPLLLNPYFFYFLIVLSFLLATISAIIYLKKNGILSFQGIKRKWRYLSILYGTTISVNLILFMIIFPITANLNSGLGLKAAIISAFGGIEKSQSTNLKSQLTLEVDIPCPGHAPLITSELKKIEGVENVKFQFPNIFEVNYDQEKTSKEQILSLEVFNTYKPTVKNEIINQTNNPRSPNITEQLPNNTFDSRRVCASCGGLSGGCGCGCGCQRR